ncbi:MAG: hypothetical protein ACREV6_20950 [Clostridium sp.]|uniref:hypothetical protein n=1 Tax=Clostridium sp. TaxID=1506 RepID=UPI003D6C7D86
MARTAVLAGLSDVSIFRLESRDIMPARLIHLRIKLHNLTSLWAVMSTPVLNLPLMLSPQVKKETKRCLSCGVTIVDKIAFKKVTNLFSKEDK